MNISGIMQFKGMSASGINLVREFQREYPAIRISFSPDLSGAVLEWDTFKNLSYLTRLAAAVMISQAEPEASGGS